MIWVKSGQEIQWDKQKQIVESIMENSAVKQL